MNLLGIHVFGELEFWFSSIKGLYYLEPVKLCLLMVTVLRSHLVGWSDPHGNNY